MRLSEKQQLALKSTVSITIIISLSTCKALLKHVKDVHSFDPGFRIECGACGQSFRVFSSYTEHVSRRHPSIVFSRELSRVKWLLAHLHILNSKWTVTLGIRAAEKRLTIIPPLPVIWSRLPTRVKAKLSTTHHRVALWRQAVNLQY